jgi:hypothetical protein
MSYAERYCKALEAFADPLTPADRTPAEEISKAESRLGISLPEALRAYYLALGRHSVNQACDRLLPPDEWYIDQGYLTFVEGHHNTFFWGFPLYDTSEDPAICLGSLGHNTIHWDTENGRCAEFLVAMMHWQAVSGWLEFVGSAGIASADLEHIRTQWQCVGEVDNGVIAFAEGSDVACVGGNDENLELIAASRTEEGYEAMDERLKALGIALKPY